MAEAKPTVEYIDPKKLDRNVDNPRQFFREDELEPLRRSIRRNGIQVPLTVYRNGSRYTLIDGERRWLSALKLNLQEVPALVQPRPSPLNNLVLMFNIHALREQWDYFTIATKLPEIKKRYKAEHGREPNEIELSDLTGLSRGQIRRCRLLEDLPTKHLALLRKELEKPKNEQRFSEDFFIEMERALKAVKNNVPEAILDADSARNTLIKKFDNNVIRNLTDFRKLSKIATATRSQTVSPATAKRALLRIFDDNDVSIDDMYRRYIEDSVTTQKVLVAARQVSAFLEELDPQDATEISAELRQELTDLANQLQRLLR